MTTCLLIHGGGHGGWCWQRVGRALRAQGHEVYAPTLTGFGERCHLGDRQTSFNTFVTDVEQVITFEDLNDVVLSDGATADKEWVLARHRRYPQAALTEPGRLTDFLALGLPTAYVTARRDVAVPPDRAAMFAGRLHSPATAEIDSSHDCMISRPVETAAALVAVTR